MSERFSLEPADEELATGSRPLPRRATVAIAVGVVALIVIVFAMRTGHRNRSSAPRSSPIGSPTAPTTGAELVPQPAPASDVLVPGLSSSAHDSGPAYAGDVEIVNDTANEVSIRFPIVTTSEFGITDLSVGIYPTGTNADPRQQTTPLRRINAHQHVLPFARFRVVCATSPAQPDPRLIAAVRLVGHPGTARYQLAGPEVYRNACAREAH
jgi:hypothetical protein